MLTALLLLPTAAGALHKLGVKLTDVDPADYCMPARRMSFERSSVLHSNLGGEGPDYSANEELVIGNVFPFAEHVVDLKVTLATPDDEYVSNAPKPNGLDGHLGTIGLDTGKQVELDFEFMYRDTGSPYQYGFYFTMLDIHPGTADAPADSVAFPKTFPANLSPDTQIETEEDGAYNVYSARGNFTDYIHSPLLVSSRELRFAVTVGVPAQPKFRMRLTNSMGSGARSFRFTGASSVVCTQSESCDRMTCPESMQLKLFANRIACHGSTCTEEDDVDVCCEVRDQPCAPDRMLNLLPPNVIQDDLRAVQANASTPLSTEGSIIIGDVYPHSASKIDLHVSVEGEYEHGGEQEATNHGEEVLLPGFCANFNALDDSSSIKTSMPHGLFGIDAASWCLGKCRDNDACEQAVVEIAGTTQSRCWLGSNRMTEFPHRSRPCASSQPACVHMCYAKRGFPNAAMPPHRFPIVGQLLAISVRANTAANVSFDFVERETGRPAEVGPFYMSVFNLLRTATSWQAISVDPSINSTVSEDSAIGPSEDEHKITSQKIFGRDIPHNILALKQEQQDQAVSFLVPRGGNFKMRLLAHGGDQTFLIGGASSIVCMMRPLCVSMTCPAGYSWRADAPSLSCTGSYCSEADVTICCEPVLPDECKDERQVTFREGNVLYSNLNGLGPDLGSPQELVFTNVLPYSGYSVDLVVVETQGQYTANAIDKNGVLSGFANVNLAGPSQATLRFKFQVRDQSLDIMALGIFPLWFTTYDLDTGKDGGGVEIVKLLTEGVETTRSKRTQVTKNGNVFTATEWGKGDDNPTSTFALTELQLDRSISFKLTEPVLELEVACTKGSQGRNFIFGGASNMVCPERASCASHTCPFGYEMLPDPTTRPCMGEVCASIDTPRCCTPVMVSECSSKYWLQFSRRKIISSNLGGIGPDLLKPESILFGDVFPDSGSVIDLNITTTSEYQVPSPYLNGVKHQFGSIKLTPGSITALQFDFVNRSDGQPPDMWPFFFSVFDVRNAVKSVDILAATWFRTSSASDLTIEGKSFFPTNSSAPHANFPAHGLALTPRQSDRAVTMQMPATSSFQMIVKLDEEDTASSRDIIFAGPSTLVCPARALCSSYTCPATHKLKDSAEFLICAGETCTDADLDTCCNIIVGSECQAKGQTVLLNTVVYSNLAGIGPDLEQPEGILYGDVLPGSDGGPVDLLVSALSVYQPFDAWSNGLDHSFGRIGVMAGADVDLSFNFINRKTQEPVSFVDPFLFTVVALDTLNNSTRIKGVQVTPHKKAILTDDTSVVKTTGLRFDGSSLQHAESPTNPISLTLEQKHQAVTFRMPQNISNFTMTMAVSPALGDVGGSFLFAGASNLVCPERALCSNFTCPAGFEAKEGSWHRACAKKTCESTDVTTCCDARTEYPECTLEGGLKLDRSIALLSNLGGHGPDHSDQQVFLISNVFPDSTSGEPIDLEVTAVDPYKPDDAKLTKLEDGIGFINMVGSSKHKEDTAKLRFRFIDRRSSNEITVSPFMFSIFDVETDTVTEPTDKQEGGQVLKRSVTVPEGTLHHTAKFSSVNVTMGGNVVATTVGSGTHVPKNPWTMQLPSRDHAIALRMPALSSFEVDVTIPAGDQGRNFAFSGSSAVACSPRALCSSYTCPTGYAPYPHRTSAACKGATCNDQDDLLRCCHVYSRPLCKDEHALDLRKNSLVYSNLGGLGPDIHAPEGMLYADVFPNSDKTMDLTITALSHEYAYKTAQPTGNGVHHFFGSINQKPGTTSDMQLQFVNRMTGEPEAVHPFYLSFFHIDAMEDGGGEEVVQVVQPEARSSQVATLTTLTNELGFFRAASGLAGTVISDLKHPMTVPVHALNQTVTFEMPNTSSVQLRLRVEEAWANATGGQFLMGGASPLVCPRRAPCTSYICPSGYVPKPDTALTCMGASCMEIDLHQCCARSKFTPCMSPNKLSFEHSKLVSNNLGVQGPETKVSEGIIIDNVFPESGEEVSMVLSAISSYQAGDISKNRLVNKSFINLNLQEGHALDVKVSFQKDGIPWKPPYPFYLSFADLDQEHESAVESITVKSEYLHAYVTHTTQLQLSKDEHGQETASIRAASTEKGKESDNPKDAMHMTDLQRDRTVSFLFSEQTGMARFRLNVAEGYGPRNILIAGVTNAVCEIGAVCKSFTCPGVLTLKGDGKTSCAGPVCGNDDIATCCELPVQK